MQQPPQFWIVGRRPIEHGCKSLEGFGGELKEPPIKQNSFRLSADGLEHEIGSAFAQRFRRSINQAFLFPARPQVNRFTVSRCRSCFGLHGLGLL